MSFADLGVSRPVADALRKRGITAPFAVQKLVIEDVLDGDDVLVQSPTGSGKTLAFGIPLVDLIEPDDRRPAALDPRPDPRAGPADRRRAAARSPLRARSRSRRSTAGSGSRSRRSRAARAQIIVATPGRLEDLLQRRAFSLEHVRVLVIDEADRMLDMGFKPAVDRIVARTPRDRQTLFFSATLEAAAGKLARAYTSDALRHVHEPVREDRGEVYAPLRPPRAHRQGRRAGRRAARCAIAAGRWSSCAPSAAPTGSSGGSASRASTRSRCTATSRRASASAPWRASPAAGSTTLVATDVAARGIDVDEIAQVINFDAPGDRDAYVHRVGRSGRAGRDGAGISFVLPDQRAEMRKIAASLGLSAEFDHRVTGGAPASTTANERRGARRRRPRRR